MAIAHHDFQESAAVGTTGDIIWLYTPPAGTLKGVTVEVVQDGSGDHVVGVTYGAAAMTRVRMDEQTVGTEEVMVTYVYFLGSGIPAGAQTITVDVDATLQDRHALVATVTADAATTEIDVSNGAGFINVTDPTLTLDYTDGLADWVAYYVLCSGNNTTFTTTQAGTTHMDSVDLGAVVGEYAFKEGTGGNSTTIGYTVVANDGAHSGIVIREPIAGVTLTPAEINLEAVAVTGTPGPVTIELTGSQIDLEAVAVTGTPGPVTTELTNAQISLEAVSVTGVPGPVSVELIPAVVDLEAVAVTGAPSSVSIDLIPAEVNLQAVSVTGSPGPIIAELSPAMLNLEAVSLGVPPPAEVPPVVKLYNLGGLLLDCACDRLTETEAGCPERRCVVPGIEPSAENCCPDGGQLTVNVVRIHPSTRFPNPDQGQTACLVPWMVATYNITVFRCMPVGHGRKPPTCDALDNAAFTAMEDMEAIWHGIRCCLSDPSLVVPVIGDGYRWMYGEQMSTDAAGGCVGSNLVVLVGIPICEDC